MARYWLSYDLGLRGNYDQLYGWLEGLDAKECGDSVATFVSDKGFEELKKELKPIVGKSARIYLIGRDAGGKWRGKWLFGSRKRAPWFGYASIPGEEVDEA
jgi:hypothetical protein